MEEKVTDENIKKTISMIKNVFGRIRKYKFTKEIQVDQLETKESISILQIPEESCVIVLGDYNNSSLHKNFIICCLSKWNNFFDVTHLIFVINKIKSCHASLQLLTEQTRYSYEIFTYDDWKFDRMNHCLVPEYEKIPLSACPYKTDQLKWMSHHDTVAKFYGFQIGDILKIKIYDCFNGYYYDYRKVVKIDV